MRRSDTMEMRCGASQPWFPRDADSDGTVKALRGSSQTQSEDCEVLFRPRFDVGCRRRGLVVSSVKEKKRKELSVRGGNRDTGVGNVIWNINKEIGS
jgi:hypothetical protein